VEIVLPDPDWIVGKHALMNIHAQRRNGRTEIDPRSWRIPYQWQGCHYQDADDQPFLLLINSGGGFVEGDVAELHGTLEPGTRALITTTAASKFYKCLEGKTSKELVNLTVGQDALLEYWPDESIPFALSRVERRTRIDLEPTSRLFATDVIAAGRIHYRDGEAFAFDQLFSEFEVTVAGRSVLTDRLVCETREEVESLGHLWDGATNSALIAVRAPALPIDLEREIEAALPGPGIRSWGATRKDDLILCRILTTEAWACQEAIFRAWTIVRPIIAQKPARPIRKC
jgi:urease accessory protein